MSFFKILLIDEKWMGMLSCRVNNRGQFIIIWLGGGFSLRIFIGFSIGLGFSLLVRFFFAGVGLLRHVDDLEVASIFHVVFRVCFWFRL